MMINSNSKTEDRKYAGLKASEIWVVEALRESLTGQKSNHKFEVEPDAQEVLDYLQVHSVLPLVENQVKSLVEEYHSTEAKRVFYEVQRYNGDKTLHSMQQIYLTKKLSDAFSQAGIKIAVLKGIATARYYGRPERRKAGDVDILLLEPQKMEEAKEIILSLGSDLVEEQKALHHIVFNYCKTNIEIELHTMLAEPFDNSRMNKYVDDLIPECALHTEYVNAFGVSIPALIGAYHAYELILHMLQHFLRAGFGLKLLCDWVVFWNCESFNEAEKKLYLRLVTESGTKGFSDMITLLCIDYLGLSEDNVAFMNLAETGKHMDVNGLLLDIFEGEEFGHSDSSRMVALRGDSLWDYIREFHHQMRLNHPRSSKCILLWPALWVITYVVFIRNNRVIRNTKAGDIYKKAGRRGKIVKQMKIFEYR